MPTPRWLHSLHPHRSLALAPTTVALSQHGRASPNARGRGLPPPPGAPRRPACWGCHAHVGSWCGVRGAMCVCVRALAVQVAEQEKIAERDLLTDLQLKRQQYKRRKEQHGDREAAVCARGGGRESRLKVQPQTHVVLTSSSPPPPPPFSSPPPAHALYADAGPPCSVPKPAEGGNKDALWSAGCKRRGSRGAGGRCSPVRCGAWGGGAAAPAATRGGGIPPPAAGLCVVCPL